MTKYHSLIYAKPRIHGKPRKSVDNSRKVGYNQLNGSRNPTKNETAPLYKVSRFAYFFCVATKVYHGIPFVSIQKRSDNLYEKFSKLCESRGVTPHKVSVETGIAYSCLTDWKAKRSKPKADKLVKLAKYFGVDIEYFIS